MNKSCLFKSSCWPLLRTCRHKVSWTGWAAGTAQIAKTTNQPVCPEFYSQWELWLPYKLCLKWLHWKYQLVRIIIALAKFLCLCSRRDSGLSRVLGNMTKLFSKNIARSTDLLFLKSLVGSNNSIRYEKNPSVSSNFFLAESIFCPK